MHGDSIEKVIQVMVTPRVVSEVRKHFNCPQLEGAELEDQGEDGTAITHWEKRVFEVMYTNRYRSDGIIVVRSRLFVLLPE